MKDKFFKDIQSVYEIYKAAQSELYEFYDVLKNPQSNLQKAQILKNLCEKLDIEPKNEHFLPLVERIVNLRQSAILEILKAQNLDSEKLKEKKDFLTDFVIDFHAKRHENFVCKIQEQNLLTPFYRQILKSAFEIGLSFNEFFKAWDRQLICGINEIFDKFDKAQILKILQNTLETQANSEMIAQNPGRTYSLPCRFDDVAKISEFKDLDSVNFQNLPYARAFPTQISQILRALENACENLQNLDDEIFNQKSEYLAYFGALKHALACQDSEKLIDSWQAVDYAWMGISAPLQICHPFEYYEDIYRHAVAPEWDLRLELQPESNDFDVKQNARDCFEFLANFVDLDSQMRDFVRNSLQKSRVFFSEPILFFGSENNGLFSAQVVPNDEVVSKKCGKKIFAFANRIIKSAQAKPKMRINYEFFESDFLDNARHILFEKENLWHCVYDLSTNGHEFGHILWVDESSESVMNRSGEFKNIEEFKATSGGILSYLFCASTATGIFKDNLEQINALECAKLQNLARQISQKVALDSEIWSAFWSDCIRRAVGLMAWREDVEVRPYYCEGLIHLSLMFESGALEFDKNDSGAKLKVNSENFALLALAYVKNYLSLAKHYIAKDDAKIWLSKFVNCQDYLPKNQNALDLAQHYWQRYKEIGQQILQD